MSARRAERGFTLLECMIATLVLSLLAVGLARLTTAHDKLLSKIEAWADGEPLYYVSQADDPMQRLVGVPAALVADPPLPLTPHSPGALEVTVTSVELELDPPQARALAHLEDA